MNPTKKAPLLIRIASAFFMFMGVVSTGILILPLAGTDYAEKITVSFISNSVSYSDHPVAFMLLSLLFIFAGVVGVCILFEAPFAYDLGILYSLLSSIILFTLTALGIGVVSSHALSYVLITLIFGGFSFYLTRNRKKWRES